MLCTRSVSGSESAKAVPANAEKTATQVSFPVNFTIFILFLNFDGAKLLKIWSPDNPHLLGFTHHSESFPFFEALAACCFFCIANEFLSQNTPSAYP